MSDSEHAVRDEPLLAGYVPAEDRHVRLLLDSGRHEEADELFDELIAGHPNLVEGDWSRAAVLSHRAVLAWRLGRIPLALDLAAEAWTELDPEEPTGPAAASAVGAMGYLMEAVGHRTSALAFLADSVRIARESGDQQVLAHCLAREGNTRMLRADEDSASRPVAEFAAAHQRLDEAVSLADPGMVRRSALAGSARALVGIGDPEQAARNAERALELSWEHEDWFTAGMAHWAMAEVHRMRGAGEQARTCSSRALDAAERVRDTMFMMRFSLDLAKICEELGDAVGQAAALRRTIRASTTAVNTLREGLGQALEQRRLAVQAQRKATAAREAASRDPLTGLVNWLGLERRAPALLEQTSAQGHVPWLVLVDVDWFKEVNDDAGHVVGDVALREIARLLTRECRADDLVCRWAGDEFVVLLVDTSESSHDAGPVVAERIRDAVAGHDWHPALGQVRKPPTVSIGVASGPVDLHSLFAAADIALYRAKGFGRNRVEIDHPPMPEPTEEPR